MGNIIDPSKFHNRSSLISNHFDYMLLDDLNGDLH